MVPSDMVLEAPLWDGGDVALHVRSRNLTDARDRTSVERR